MVLLEVDRSRGGTGIAQLTALTAACKSSLRREMMPLLSLLFSALFILFGTVIVQAFR